MFNIDQGMIMNKLRRSMAFHKIWLHLAKLAQLRPDAM